MGKVIVTSLKYRKRVLEYNLKRGPGIFGHLDSYHAISVEDPALLPIHSRIFLSVVIKYVCKTLIFVETNIPRNWMLL